MSQIREVGIVWVGTSASRKVDFESIDEYFKSVAFSRRNLGVIDALPLPSAPSPPYTASHQYAAGQIFTLTESCMTLSPTSAIVALIDHEVYNEVFSTIDPSRNLVIISLRNSTLQRILDAANATLEEFVVLELSLQLLALQFRDSPANANLLSNDPIRPWHLDRRQCLFDYFGLSPTDVAKLREPSLCSECTTLIRAVADVSDLYANLQATFERLSRRDWKRKLGYFFSDPFNSFLSGAAAGILPAALNLPIANYFLSAAFLVLAGVRVRSATKAKWIAK